MIELLIIAGAKVSLTGSTVVPGCEPEDTDWLVDCSMRFGRKKIYNAVRAELSQTNAFQLAPESLGPRYDTRMEVWNQFSWEQGGQRTHFILTRDRKLAEKWRFATDLMASLRLTQKKDRVRLFQALIYGEIETLEKA